MLCLSRKVGEKLSIGPDIVVTILDVDRGKVRVGITAPKHVQIYRTELLSKPDFNPPVVRAETEAP